MNGPQTIINFCTGAFLFVGLSSTAYPAMQYMVAITAETAANKSANLFVHKVLKNLGAQLAVNREKAQNTLTFSRKLLVQAHPEANLDMEMPKALKSAHKQIFPLQQELETKALENALVIDCKSKGADSLSNCGIYEYSRQKSAVIASASKVFSVPLKDAGAWADALTDNLVSGIKARESYEADKQLQKFLTKASSEKNTEPSSAEYALGLGFGNARFKEASSMGSGLFLASTSAGAHRVALRIEAGLGSFHDSRYWEACTAAELTMGAEALDTLRWELGFGGGPCWISIPNKKWRELSLQISLRPGFSLALGGGARAGFDYGFSFQSPLSEKNRAAFEQTYASNMRMNNFRHRLTVRLGMEF